PFHVSGIGTAALSAVSIQMEPDDYIVPYYRDRGLILGRGMTTRQLGLEYFAKRNTGSGGRQMPSHYSNADLHIWSVPTPTGSQLLPACGMAWGIQLDGKKNLVVTTVGDAATSQGDFFEALCFAAEKKLYRSAEELQALEKSDPLKCWKDQLIQEDVITAEEFAKLDNEVKERIRREYTEAEKAENPSPNDLLGNLSESPPKLNKEILPPGKYRIGDTVNKTLRAGLEDDS